jgi:hypothetical protein
VAVADVVVEVVEVDEIEDVAVLVVAVEEVAGPMEEAAKDKEDDTSDTEIWRIHNGKMY